MQFISPEGLDLDRALIGSAPLTPIVIISPPSFDVLANLSKFVIDQGKLDKFVTISLGDDAERLHQAEALLSQALTQGHWVFIHQIHRRPSWLANVENLLENASSSSASTPVPVMAAAAAGKGLNTVAATATTGGTTLLHSEFRLWLHCAATLDTVVPVRILLSPSLFHFPSLPPFPLSPALPMSLVV